MFGLKTGKETLKRLSAMALSVCLLAGVCTTPVYAAAELNVGTPEIQTPETAVAGAVESSPAPEEPLKDPAQEPSLQDVDVDEAIVCTLTPKKEVYGAGETMQFVLTAQFSAPGNDSSPQTVKLAINLPEEAAAKAKLPMFNRTGSGEYAGVPMYSLSYGGNTVNLYLVTLPDGKRRIEFTLNAGDTIQGILSMYLPNGITEPIPAYTLTPEVLSGDDYGEPRLQSGTVEIDAEFGWDPVQMDSSTNNIGVVSDENRGAESVTMTITADGKTNGLASGAVFTDKYTLTANTVLNSMHINNGTLTYNESAGVTTYYIDGVKVLTVGEPMDSLTVVPQLSADETAITGFKIVYTGSNTTLAGDAPKPLPNLSMPITLFTKGLVLNDSHPETSIVTTVEFDAYSPFYDEEAGKTDEKYHHHSEQVNTIYTTDNYILDKDIYTDPACEEPFDTAKDFMEKGRTYYYKIVARNLSGDTGAFKIEDVLPDGLEYSSTVKGGEPAVNTNTLTWEGVSIPAGGTYEIVIATEFEIDRISSDTLKNIATLSNAEKGELASDFVQTTFRAGESSDADIKYTKKANKAAGGVGDPLTYTIDVKNDNPNASKYITVQDNWPGDKVIPVSAAVAKPGTCTEIVLVDDAGVKYHFGDDFTGVKIEKIQFKGLYIPAGSTVRLTINSTIIGEFDKLVNTVQTGTGTGPVTESTPAYGISIGKTAYEYTEKEGVGRQLTIQDLMKKDDTVCYKIVVTNLKSGLITGATITDKLPSYLPLTEGAVDGVTGKILLEQNGEVKAVASDRDPDTGFYTSPEFSLEKSESVTFYIFVKVDEATIAEAKKSKNCVTNAAVASFNGLQTGETKANFYIYEDTTKYCRIFKEVLWIGNYTDDLEFVDTGLKTWALGKGADQRNTTSIQKDNIVIYRITVINNSGAGYTMPIYEVLDKIPDGMEFVGILKSGNRDITNTTYRNDLSDKLIRDGETATWENGGTGTLEFPVYTAELSCNYDAAARTVHVLVNGGDIDNPFNLNNSYQNSNQQAFFYVVTKATEAKASYRNTCEIKTSTNVLNKENLEFRDEDPFRYFQQTVTTYSVKMTPGITKSLLGHYYPDEEPERLVTDSTIQPDESLRYQIQIKNQDGSDRETAYAETATAPTYSFIKDYTVTDILPAEYTYKRGSTTFAINRTYDKKTGEQVTLTGTALKHKEPAAYTSQNSGTKFEPTEELLPDGRTKLTWTFNEYEYRLLNAFSGDYKDLGFMNILTYDVDRNTEYGSAFGSYTNMASVKFGYGFSNVSTGSPDRAANTVSATNIVNVFGAAGTSAVKTIAKLDGSKKATGLDDVNKIEIAAGEIVRYTMQVTNATEDSTVGQLVLIDELPREENDTGVVNRTARGSEFSMFFTDTPNISVQLVSGGEKKEIGAENYTVYYGTSTGSGLKAKGDWTVAEGGYIAWAEGSGEGKNAIRIVFASDFKITAAQAIEVSLDAKAADTLKNKKDILPGSTAWNSFGYAYQAIEQDGTKLPTIHSEPQKVGAYLAGTQITLTKKVTGENYPADKPFTFKLTVNGVGQADVAYRLDDETKVYYTDAEGRFTLMADQTATIYMRPVAAGGGLTEITADMPDYFTFVSAEGDGAADADNPNSFVFGEAGDGTRKNVAFTNKYAAPAPAELVLAVTKALEGPKLPASARFEFTLARADDGAASDVEMPSAAACKTGTSAMMEGTSAELSFGAITFKAAGFYRFTITETPSGIPGMVDAKTQTVYVNVTDPEENGTLRAVVTDENKNPVADGGKCTFTNVYDPADTAVVFSVKKTIDAANGLSLPQAAEFTFDLALKEVKEGNADCVVMPEDASVTTAAISSGSSAPVSFGSVGFKGAGEYVFAISERATGIPSMTDAADREITVTVTDTDGVLSAAVSPANPAGGYEFTNSYAAGKLTAAALNVTKRIAGEALPQAKAFTFTLALAEGDAAGVIMPEKTSVKTAAISSGSAEPVGFGDIVFTKAGTYVFEITEEASGIAGMTDAPAQKVTVQVTEKDGILTPAVTSDGGGGRVFVNRYAPAAAALNLAVQKKISGGTLAAAKTFSFTLALAEGDAAHVKMPEKTGIETAAITGGTSAAAYFGEVVFDKAGAYVFEITEAASGIKGMKDAAPQRISVTVTDAGGKLTAKTADGKTQFVFVNEYTKPVTPTPTPAPTATPAPTVTPGPAATQAPTATPAPAKPAETAKPDAAAEKAASTVPQTGDSMNPLLYAALLFGSAVGLIGTVIFGKKKKDETR